MLDVHQHRRHGSTEWELHSGSLKGILAADEVRLVPPPVQSGGYRAALLLSEPGLYRLIMRSDKPAARQFQDWVVRDVMPAIRKDGGYIAGEE